MWRRNPVIFMIGLQSVEDHIDWNTAAVKLWEAPFDVSVKMSSGYDAKCFFGDVHDSKSSMMLWVVKYSS